MKIRSMIAFTALMTSSVAIAGPLTNEERDYVITATTASIVYDQCVPWFEVIDGSLRKIALSKGIDYDLYDRVIDKAIDPQSTPTSPVPKDQAGQEIAKVARDLGNQIYSEWIHAPSKTCAKWGEPLIGLGVARKKSQTPEK